VSGGITGPGVYSLTALNFTDLTAGVSETGFVSGSMTVSESGAIDQFSVLGCLPSCGTGNQLALEFSLPQSVLYSNGSAFPVSPLLPMDLLEDDGSTDIHGTVDSYSYDGPGPGTGTPEPVSFALAGLCLVAIGTFRRFGRQ